MFISIPERPAGRSCTNKRVKDQYFRVIFYNASFFQNLMDSRTLWIPKPYGWVSKPYGLKKPYGFQNLMTPIFLLPGKTDLSKYFLNMFGQPQDQQGLSLVQDSVKTNIHIH